MKARNARPLVWMGMLVFLPFLCGGCRTAEAYTRYDLNTRYETVGRHYVSIAGPSGQLAICEDGSGSLGYVSARASAGTYGQFGCGTFDFEQVTAELQQTCSPGKPSGSTSGVYTVQMIVSEVKVEPAWNWFHGKSRCGEPYPTTVTLWTGELGKVEPLFDTAVAAIKASISAAKQTVERREAGMNEYEAQRKRK
jgi:hypothetical protein